MNPKQIVVAVLWALAIQEIGAARAYKLRLQTVAGHGLRLVV